MGVEQSGTYQAFTMELLLMGREVTPLGSQLDARLIAGAHFLDTLSGFRFGDDDEGRVARPVLDDTNYVGSITALTRTLLGDHEATSTPDGRAAAFGLTGVVPASPPEAGEFPVGGYTMLSQRGALPVRCLVDHGPLGYRWTGSHGHADALAVSVRIGGRPVLVDRGTFRYNSGGGWRDYARSTQAHNTVTVNQRSQSEPTGPFNWGRRAKVSRTEGNTTRVVAHHQGYDDVVHKRTVEMHRDRLVFIDDLDGTGTHHVAIWWHLAPGLTSVHSGDLMVIQGLDHPLRMHLPPALSAVIHVHGDTPGPGTHGVAYNQWTPATSLEVSGSVELPQRFVTELHF